MIIKLKNGFYFKRIMQIYKYNQYDTLKNYEGHLG